MSAEPVDDLSVYLATVLTGKTIKRFAWTSEPDEQIALIPSPAGLPSEQAFGDDDLKWEYPRVQVVARGPKGDPRAAVTVAQAAYRALGKIAAVMVNGTYYHKVTCLQPPFPMGVDDNGRPLFGFNLQIEKELSA